MASFFAFLLLLIASTAPSVRGGENLTAYEVLQQYDFPIGLLPSGVTGYELDSSTGKFSAYLNGTCKFAIESYELEYKSTITGIITKDKISSLKGIEVKVLVLWLNIVEVIRDGDELQFSVGIASANFPVSNFAECPSCGCGFDCVNETEKMIKLNRLVSSA
ncbi:hypothetical protein HS088_TW17G00170 [Tripterygium wilfordii]|uniref:Uncharacterized protein n=1 Tax=Tripterygium wilfordii TaxID=458696 RepID=A0A7J7CEX4_TRIWF|nr:uncharacterized protein At5g01610-like [Tripterygium wilfordii]KAF5732640.1 hypothetical protein HS088_TW17G00170 [Tripterygium wilfordii]